MRLADVEARRVPAGRALARYPSTGPAGVSAAIDLLGKTSRMGTDRGRRGMAAIALLADELRQQLYAFP